jgi:UDPglucose 6-dehydrogenase
MCNISIIGAGYVGLVTAAGFAELGHNVTLVEIDPERVSTLESGVLPISEPGLVDLWQRHQTGGRIHVTANYLQGLLGAQFAFIAVGTPSTRNGKPDLKYVRLAAKSIAESASSPLIIVIKSTVPVGTADLVTGVLSRFNHNCQNIKVVSNPEFLREGLAVFDFMNPTRVVVGGVDPGAIDSVARLYEPLHAPTVICDSGTAEMSKYASNVFLAARISFMNEIALLCDEYGVDVVKVASIMGLDSRFGKDYLNAGMGWGGSCLPKDVRGLIYIAKSRGVPLRLVSAVQRINQQQPYVVVRKLRRLLGFLEGKTIGILGLSFKPNSDDMREASSLALISILNEQGCLVKAYDPLAMDTAAKLMPEVTFCNDAYEVARCSDALVLVTEWKEFKELDMDTLSSLMNQPVIIDGRNLYDPDEMSDKGFTYEGIGRRGARARLTGHAQDKTDEILVKQPITRQEGVKSHLQAG